MKFELDDARCEGYGFCEERAPALLRLDDNGSLDILVKGDLDPEVVATAQKAVRSCPVAALALKD